MVQRERSKPMLNPTNTQKQYIMDMLHNIAYLHSVLTSSSTSFYPRINVSNLHSANQPLSPTQGPIHSYGHAPEEGKVQCQRLQRRRAAYRGRMPLLPEKFPRQASNVGRSQYDGLEDCKKNHERSAETSSYEGYSANMKQNRNRCE